MPLFNKFANHVVKKDQRILNWFPGHMYKGMKQVLAKLSTVDCVIEVHDARIPFSGRNNDFRKNLIAIKPSLLVLNKRDLADLSNWNMYRKELLKQGYKDVLLTDMTGSSFNMNERGYLDMGQKIMDVIRGSDRYNRMNSDLYRVMIVGLPNVGKSTLINRLRQHYLGFGGEPATTGAQPGVTRAVAQTIQICGNPRIYVIDTPGILHPTSLKSDDEGCRIALCSSISDNVVDVEMLSKYLLKYLNKNGMTNYTLSMGMKGPTEDLTELVCYAAFHHNYFINNTGSRGSDAIPDVARICNKFIKEFRLGLYGKSMLDSIDDSSFIS